MKAKKLLVSGAAAALALTGAAAATTANASSSESLASSSCNSSSTNKCDSYGQKGTSSRWDQAFDSCSSRPGYSNYFQRFICAGNRLMGSNK